MSLGRYVLCGAFLFLHVASSGRAGTITVGGESGNDFTEIQPALNAAENGDLCLVQPGEYEIQESLDFLGKAVILRSLGGAEETVIRMARSSIRRSVVTFVNGESEEAQLDGFTITGGTGTDGGGILCRNGARPTLLNLIVVENSASYGGSIHCNQSSPTLKNCDLSRNSVICGGAAYCDASSPTFMDCTMAGNLGRYASTVHSKNGSSPLLRSCRIVGNTTLYGGGVDSYSSSPTLINCIIAGNTADMGGGMYCSGGFLSLVNCTIVGNRAEEGGAFFGGKESVGLTNCILWNNFPDSYSYSPYAYNCIVGLNPSFLEPGVFDFSRFKVIDIAGVPESLPDFILVEPCFQLRGNSPAIDQGTIQYDVPATDIDGVKRPCGPEVDIGAYEYCGSPPAAFRRGDAVEDGEINISDGIRTISYLFHEYSTISPSSCPKAMDFDDNGELEIADVISLLGYLFIEGSPPGAPFPGCGDDPNPDQLNCDSYNGCAVPL